MEKNIKMQCNTIQYNTIQYNTIQYNTIQYNTIQYNTMRYNTMIKLYLIALSDYPVVFANQSIKIQYKTKPYFTIQYNTIQYNTIQYNTIQYNRSLPKSFLAGAAGPRLPGTEIQVKIE